MKFQKGDLIEFIREIPGMNPYKGYALVMKANDKGSMGGIYTFFRLNDSKEDTFFSYWVDDPEHAEKIG